jgi:hypothetical protein
MTFAAPGQRVVQITAINGAGAVRRSLTIQIEPQRQDTLIARLRVTDRGTRTEKRQQTESVPITIPRNSRSAMAIDRKVSPRHGAKILEAKIGPVDPAFKNLQAIVSPDGRSVQITGTLSPTTAMMQSPTPPMIPLILTCERHSNLLAPPTDISASVTIPGSASLTLPAVSTSNQAHRTMVLEMRSATGQTWKQPLPDSSNSFEFGGRHYTISVKATQSEVKIDVVPQTFGVTSRPK